jgi:hypothetical protein
LAIHAPRRPWNGPSPILGYRLTAVVALMGRDAARCMRLRVRERVGAEHLLGLSSEVSDIHSTAVNGEQ